MNRIQNPGLPDIRSGSRSRRGSHRLTASCIALLMHGFATSTASAQAPPSTFSQNVTDGSSTVTVNFALHPVRGPNFSVLVQDASGNLVSHTADVERTYIGTISGYPGAIAAGVLRADGTVLCRISFENGVEWASSAGSGSTATASIRGSANYTPNWPGTVSPAGGAGSTVYAAEVGVDATYREYTACGSDVDATIEMAQFSLMATNTVYLRDAAILHRLGRVVVRTSQTYDPYEADGGDTGLLLPHVRDIWNNVLPASTHDIALVARPGAGGGLAYVGTVGTASRYSANATEGNGDFSIYWRHEAGHNWSSSHFEGGTPEGPTIMSGNSLSRFSGSELAKVLNHRNAKTSILDNLGSYSFPLPPRASADRATITIGGSPVTIDVLANDTDSNGQTITILSFDATSAKGGTITRSTGTGPGGRDQLVYTPAAGFLSDFDHFNYRIQDSAGYQGIAKVFVKPSETADLVGHWTFDEGSGAEAGDTTILQRTAPLTGSPAWTTGTIGGAIELDGSTQYASVPAFGMTVNTYTICGWVKRNGAQSSYAGIGFHRGSTTAGLNFGTANELRYHWGAGSNPSYNFNSGLVVPDNTWSFCALVIEPTKATLYLDAGAGLQSATATGTFNAVNFDSTLYLGQDPNGGRFFKGQLDDFRVFRRSLTAAEIASISQRNGTPSAPSPALFTTRISGVPGSLSWTAPPASASHNYYLGSTYAAVRDATPSSAEYAGTSTTASWNPGTLAPGTYFWRVDETLGATTFKGPIWSFNVAQDPLDGLVGWWKLDETSGTLADDSSAGGGADGTVNGATWATGLRAGGLSFDGVNDFVSAGTGASLNGGGGFSVSAWVKIPSGSTVQGTIIQQRGPAGGSTNGYNGQYMLQVTGGGLLSFTVYGGSNYQFNGFTGTTALNDGQWHHVMAQRDGTAGRLYVDGVLDGSTTGTVRSLVSNIPVYLGRDGRDNNRPFNGVLDDVRVYNRVLGADDLAALVNRAPAFSAGTLALADATIGAAYSAGVSGSASDPDSPLGESLTFSKDAGPAWVSVASNGAITGTPGIGDGGTNGLTVRVVDSRGAFATATVVIVVRPPLGGVTDTDGDTYPDALELAAGSDPQSSGSVPASIYQGLHAWWRFDESGGATAYDSSGRNAGGSITGGTRTDGRIREGLGFDGNDVVACGTAASLNGTTALTLAAWVKIPSGSSTTGVILQQRSVADGTTNGYNGEYQLTVNSAGKLAFMLYGNSAYQFSGFSGATSINDGQWHHVVAQRDGTAGRLYVDGVLDASTTGTARSLVSNIPVYIGVDQRDSVSWLNGTLDDVRIYSRALTATEIATIAAAPLPPPWQQADIGGTAGAIVASQSGSTFTVKGMGSLADPDDRTALAYQVMSGDGEITARLGGDDATASGARIGVMIRDSLATNSPHVFVGIDGAGAATRVSRSGATTTTSALPWAGAPGWVKIVRSGGTLTSYLSNDGTHWTQAATLGLTMTGPDYIGLVTGSGGTGTTSTATFDNVLVAP